MAEFPKETVQQVLAHMNDDHSADNLIIARAHGYADATAAVMTGLDGNAGTWTVTDAEGVTHELRVAWPGAPIFERAEIRREVVALFDEALAHLGLPPRDQASEHAEHAEHGEHAHTHYTGQRNPADGAEKPFSVVVRESSRDAHSDSEGASFMADIMRGTASLAHYEQLVEQHYVMYEALEQVSVLLENSEVTAHFAVPELRRLPALERDLQYLWGPDWRDRVAAVPATAEYAARMREVAAQGWLPGIVAHHYTRYLGDLSGGQMIAKRMRQTHGLEQAGVEFYDFTPLGDLAAFKNRYRGWLDMLGQTLDAAERQRFLDEVGLAYEFNTRVFADLAARQAR